MKEKKVSIIIPVFNVKRFVTDCLVSCAEQSYPDLEIIVVNDGSTDGSEKIINDMAQKYQNLYVVNQNNGGLSSARNAGLKKATGDFILFVDSDDILACGAVEKIMNSINESQDDIDMVMFQPLRITENDHYTAVKESGQTGTQEELSSSEALTLLLKRDIENFSWSMMIKKRIYLDNQIEFPVNRKYEDVATTYKLISCSNKILVTDQKLYLYRLRANSITTTYSESTFYGLQDTLSEMSNYLKHKNNDVYKMYFNNFAISFLLIGYYDNFRSQSLNRKQLGRQIRAQILKRFRAKSGSFLKPRYFWGCVFVRLHIFNVMQNIRIAIRK